MKHIGSAAVMAVALAGCTQSAQPDADASPTADTAAPAAAAPDVDASVTAFYAPYMRVYTTGDPAVWERSIYSAGLTKLIDRWEAGLVEEELNELQDFDWLCECQDYDHTTFKPTIRPHEASAGGRATIDVDLSIGWGETRTQRLDLVLEDGEWRIDDMRSEAFPDGLKAELPLATQRNAGAAT